MDVGTTVKYAAGGALALGAAVGGAVMHERVRATSGDPYSGTLLRNGWVIPRREVLENLGAWAGAGTLMAAGSKLEGRGGAIGMVGAGAFMLGAGFMAGQVASFIP